MLIPEVITETLIAVASALSQDTAWAVDGSCALALQDIEVVPHDIDILTDAVTAYEIEKVLTQFTEKSVKYGETSQWRSHFGIFRINTVKVEVMGDLQSFRNGKWSSIQNPHSVPVKQILVNSVRIPVVDLSYLQESGYLEKRLKRS